MDDLFAPETDARKHLELRLPPDIDALIQLSEGLNYIHSMGFVHRDIKPSNVFISYPSDREALSVMKWADFGLSKPVNERGTFSMSGMKGTWNWVAPEILRSFDENVRYKKHLAHHSKLQQGRYLPISFEFV